jgi:hypothetical protein
LAQNTGLKGIMFWRWAGVDPTAVLANFDEAATIGAHLAPFYQVYFFQGLSSRDLVLGRGLEPDRQHRRLHQAATNIAPTGPV